MEARTLACRTRRVRPEREVSGMGRVADPGGGSEAGSGDVVHFGRGLAAMHKKLMKAIAKGEYVDFGRFPILRDLDGAKEEGESWWQPALPPS